MLFVAGPGTAVPPWSRTLTSRARTPSCSRTSRRTRPVCGASRASSPHPWHPEPLRGGRRRFDQRGRRTRLLTRSCGRSGDGQPGPHGRVRRGRRRGRDGTAGGVVEGAVLPRCQSGRRRPPDSALNGYKISGPTVLGRRTDDEVLAVLRAFGWDAVLVAGDDPMEVHRDLAETLDRAHTAITRIRRDARDSGLTDRPRWPAIVLRTPKGWTGPTSSTASRSRARSAPIRCPSPTSATTPNICGDSRSGCGRTRPTNSSIRRDAGTGTRRARPSGDLRMGANPHANGGRLLRELEVRPPTATPSRCRSPAPSTTRRRGRSVRCCATSTSRTGRLPVVLPGRDEQQPTGRRVRGHRPVFRGHRRPG